MLRARPTGEHTYRVRLKTRQWLTLGTAGALKPADAREAARTHRAKGDLGELPASTRRAGQGITLREFIENHYRAWCALNLDTKEETCDRLAGVFSSLLDTPLGDLTEATLKPWRTARLKAGIARTTLNRDVGALKAALTRAVTWKKLAAHPLKGVKPDKTDKLGVVRFLSAKEEQRLRAALDARDTRLRTERERANAWRAERGYAEWPALGPYADHLTPLVLVALNTGLRRGELFGLRWKDVDLTRKTLAVRGTEAKSGETRHVPLNGEAVRVLTTWRPKGAAPTHCVFPGDDDTTPLVDIKSAWLPVVRAAKLDAPFRFHDTRHHFASRLVMAGVDLNTVRELLGHHNLTMTLRYAHLSRSTRRTPWRSSTKGCRHEWARAGAVVARGPRRAPARGA